MALRMILWQCRSPRPVLELMAVTDRYELVPSARADHAIVASTQRVDEGSEDSCKSRMYSDRGTAGRGIESASRSILVMVESDLSPSETAAVEDRGARSCPGEERPGGAAP
jgi:hypothetical protein